VNIIMTSVSAIALAVATVGLFAITQDEGPAPADRNSPFAGPVAEPDPAADGIADTGATAAEAAVDRVTPVELPATARLSVDGEEVPHPVWHATVMPGETLALNLNMPGQARLDGETISDTANIRWRAPDSAGVHDLRIEAANGEMFRLSVFVLQPLNGQTVLEGYRIGTYPRNAPEGLIRITREDLDAPISPGFTIGQFICKQQPGHWPKFLLVSSNMLIRLEALLSELREDELTAADSFFIMSGYRTPFYNNAIGSARYSRHMYGDASDIYPDVLGGDGVMDDLNGDGRVTRADAEFLYDYASRLFTSRDDVPAGGIGAYGANAVHGPFVHIDGRGRIARWGRHGS
jgi:hypothetical protein